MLQVLEINIIRHRVDDRPQQVALFDEGQLGFLKVGDKAVDAHHANDAAAAVAQGHFSHQHPDPFIPHLQLRRHVNFLADDGLAGFAQLLFFAPPGIRRYCGEKLVICQADQAAPLKHILKRLVNQHILAMDILDVNFVRDVINHRAQQGAFCLQVEFAALLLGDVPVNADQPYDAAAAVAQGHFCFQHPFCLSGGRHDGRDGAFLVKDGTALGHDLLFSGAQHIRH